MQQYQFGFCISYNKLLEGSVYSIGGHDVIELSTIVVYNRLDEVASMPTPEAFEKFLEDVKFQIDELDKAKKQNAEETLRAVAKYYQQRVAERVASELALADECRRTGDEMSAKHHTVLAEIYKSLFNIHQGRE